MKNKKIINKIIGALFLVASITSCAPTTTPTSDPTSAPTSEPTTVTPTVDPTSTPTIDPNTYVSTKYQNPIIPKNSKGEDMPGAADPAIVKGDDGYYYIFYTATGGGRAIRSKDCVNWELAIGQVIPRPKWGDGGINNPNVWAPEVVKIKDKWIFYYSLSGWDNPIGIGYAVADNIAGPYEDKGPLVKGLELKNYNCIDPCIYQEDGRVFMAVGSFRGIDLIELTEDGMALKGGIETQVEEKTLISGVYGEWNGGGTEGSYIIKKDGIYYYFGSSGLCCEGAGSTYRVVVARSKSLAGPYVDDQRRPMANFNGNGKVICWAKTTNTDIAGPGHCSIFKDDAGDYWMAYHCYCKDDGYGSRHLMLDKLLWDDEGWPYIENNTPSYHELKDGPRFIEK